MLEVRGAEMNKTPISSPQGALTHAHTLYNIVWQMICKKAPAEWSSVGATKDVVGKQGGFRGWGVKSYRRGGSVEASLWDRLLLWDRSSPHWGISSLRSKEALGCAAYWRDSKMSQEGTWQHGGYHEENMLMATRLLNYPPYIPLPMGHTASPRELKDCNKCQMNLPEIAYRTRGFQVNSIVLGIRVPHVCMNMLASWRAT